MDRVSVIIPTYNRAPLVPRAVASALAAIEPGDEIIVVDDGSTDDTDAALAPFGDRIRYLRIENRGAGGARNHGLRNARYPLIAFLDSDDEWMPGSLGTRRALMDARPELTFCFTDFAVRNEDGSEERNYIANWHNDPRSWEEILGPGVPFSSVARPPAGLEETPVHIGDMYPRILEGIFFPVWTALVRRGGLGNEIYYPEDLPICEDYSWVGQIARHGPAAFIDCETAWNHGHSGPRISEQFGTHRFYTARLKMIQRIWGADEAFLARHGELYRKTESAIYLQRARWHLSRGENREAQADLKAAGVAPLLLHALATLPGPVVRGLGRVRRQSLMLRSRLLGNAAGAFLGLAVDFPVA